MNKIKITAGYWWYWWKDKETHKPLTPKQAIFTDLNETEIEIEKSEELKNNDNAVLFVVRMQ